MGFVTNKYSGMILIIDSGSTKSDWVLLERNKEEQFFSTKGFNPLFHDEKMIYEEIALNSELLAISKDVKSVYFYGAGCSSPEKTLIVENAFRKIFIHAKISVEHDLLAAALACYSGKPIIACILGTGSNSCFFDGVNLSQQNPALGYILGDEASGSYFGKQLLSSFLYKKLPKNIESDFLLEFNLDKNQIIDNVYKLPNANVYLASFMKFIVKHHKEDFFKKMIFDGMMKFIEIHVCAFSNHRQVDVNFIGSIAYFFKEELQNVADEMNVKIGKIIQKPIDGLIQYHLKDLI
ncbi:MAG: hypothetical protein V4622_13535 [Bacteroidota bacterium]